MTHFQIQTTIAKYILDHPKTKSMDNTDIYKGWQEEYKDSIKDGVFMFDMLNIIDNLKVMDRELLKECVTDDLSSEYY